MLRSGDDVGGFFDLCGIRMDHPLREHRGGRLVRLVVVLERHLLDVHRRAQHDRAGLELGEVERLAHAVVRHLRGRDADEAGLAAGGERRLVHALEVLVVIRGEFAAERDQRRRGAAGGEQRGGKLRDARPAGRGGNARGARHARPAVGHAEPGALMAHFEHLDAAELVQLVHPVHVAVAHDAEDVRDAFGDEIGGEPLVHLHTFSPLPLR